MGEFPKIEDFFLDDAEERAIPLEVEQKMMEEMYELLSSVREKNLKRTKKRRKIRYSDFFY